jgi:hypothetical protein
VVDEIGSSVGNVSVANSAPTHDHQQQQPIRPQMRPQQAAQTHDASIVATPCRNVSTISAWPVQVMNG